MTFPPSFLSQSSANALISDLRPTTLSRQALGFLNALLDELLVSLLSVAGSLNPKDLRLNAIPAVFSGEKSGSDSTSMRALGRSAVSEAEVELRSWYDGQGVAGRGGFGKDGSGNGMIRGEFALLQAAELMRIKGATFCTLAAEEPPPKAVEDNALSAWSAAGGDPSEKMIDPAGLWITAIIEHFCEHILSHMARVVARDSSISVAGPQDLYVALCEDESIYGIFNKMKTKEALEAAIRSASRTKRSNPPNQFSPPGGTKLAGHQSPSHGSPHGSKTSLVHRDFNSISDPSLRKSSSPPSSYDDRASVENPRLGAIANSSKRKASFTKKGFLGRDKESSHERSNSVLSVNTRTMIGAFNDHAETTDRARSPQDDVDDFDALMRSGETMKVSLTPSRLKTFETGRKSQPGSPTQPAFPRQSAVPPVPVSSGVSDTSPRRRPTPSAPVADSSRTPPRPGNRSRSSSQAKLTARGATTIAEGDDEEEVAPGAQQVRRESLAEALSGGPPEPVSPPTTSARRTAPAVLLGTPPPPSAESAMPIPPVPPVPRRTPPTSSLNRPSRRVVSGDADEDDDLGFGRPRPRKKTEAQELADFLNSTTPSPPSSHTPLRGPEEPKNNKGLKGFMSKISGKGKETAKSRNKGVMDEIPTVDPALVAAKRKQSLQSGSSIRSSEVTPSVRSHEGMMPPVPPQKAVTRRQMTEGKENAVAVSVVGAAAGATLGAVAVTVGAAEAASHQEPSRLSPTPVSTESTPSMSTGIPEANGTQVQAEAKPADLPTRQMEDEQTAPSAEGIKEIDSVPESAELRETIAPPKEVEQEASPTTLGPAPADASISSDTGSVVTAEEALAPVAMDGESAAMSKDSSYSQEDLGAERAVNTEPPATLAEAAEIEPKPEPIVQPTTAPAPSIPLADLVPLRTLFEHATSARECQLLMGAVLSQWGVPLHPATSDEDISPEDRVAAWLLAGREGPVTATSPSASSFSKMTTENEEIRTPTDTTPKQLASAEIISSTAEREDLEQVEEDQVKNEEIAPRIGEVDEGVLPAEKGPGKGEDEGEVADGYSVAKVGMGMIGRLMPGGLGTVGGTGANTPAVEATG